MQEVICVDGSFPKDMLDFYEKYGVKTPIQDKLYTIANIIINSNGKRGVILEELKNPKVPINHPLFPQEATQVEPNWYIGRFRTLSGEIVNERELSKELKTTH